MSPTISAFIISWTGQKSNAMEIEGHLADKVERLAVIHSDEEAKPTAASERWILVPNEWFYGRKFCRCLEDFEADIMLQITADVTCADWDSLIRRCREGFRGIRNLGLWAPNVDYSYFSLGRTSIAQLGQSPIHFVTMVDAIVWAASRDVIGRLRGLNYEVNNLGWGIERLAALYCHSNNRLVVLDESVAVRHPRATGYSRVEAGVQYNAFMRQATLPEKLHDSLITRYMDDGPRG